MGIRIEELDGLLEAWGKGPTHFPKEAADLVHSLSAPLGTKYFSEIAGKLAVGKIFEESKILTLINQVTVRVWAWGVLSYAIGGEISIGNINRDKEFPLHYIVNDSLSNYFMDYATILVTNGKITMTELMKLQKQLRAELTEKSSAISFWGSTFYSSQQSNLKPGAGSKLATALLKIDLAEVYEAMKKKNN